MCQGGSCSGELGSSSSGAALREGTSDISQQESNRSNRLITNLINSVSNKHLGHQFPVLWLKRAASLLEASSVSKT